MSIPHYGRVKEGIELIKQVSLGAMVFALVPLQLLAPIGTLTTESKTPWQTELVLAEKQPELLAFTSDVAIEKSNSRYQEEQAKRKPVVTKTTATVTQSSCRDMTDTEKYEYAAKAASRFGIPTNLLIAVWKAESGMRGCTAVTSYAGARGPMQFMPGTWRAYAEDGNNDGTKNVLDARDALFGAAKLLSVNGASAGDYRRALLRYNNADWYVKKVLAMAGM